MAVIKLSQGKEAIVDDEDFVWLSQWTWSSAKTIRGAYYAVRHETKAEYGSNPRRMRKMHREILEKHGLDTNGLYVDHKSHDGLDNQKVNLRVATNSQNQANAKLWATNTSGYRGVLKYAAKKPWAIRITYKGKKFFKGMFWTKEEAALAYNELAKELFGEFATLNEVRREQ